MVIDASYQMLTEEVENEEAHLATLAKLIVT